ncbi:MAG: 3-oxoacyl-[acyl-carrier-protein] reductase [Candidatus Sericytochromatia bacterium]
MKNMEGQVAIVTGGSRGIGKAIALRLAEAGCKVVINYARNAEAAEATRAAIEGAGGTALILQGDVADPATAEALVKAATETWGRLDVVVNNAGITKDGLLVRMKDEDWNAVLQTDLSSAFYLTRAASKVMMKARAGRIINITSVVGLIGNAGQANYAAAKAGLVGLTKAVAKELASRNILVNAVAPGFIASEMTEAMTEEAKQGSLAAIPLGRYGQPEEIAAMVHFLATEAGYVTGQVFCVDGGMAM